MKEKTKVMTITLYPQEIQYLNDMKKLGYSRSAVIRNSLALYMSHSKAHLDTL